ncbi:cysteine rich repeat-containing protein [Terrarubrum flagellatum]|uniref:cysteine rich repeat-containing protein n=1 Tax=Terrirubrum flagellatum TaxID=2895980 RepID=UPI003145602E
MSAHFRAIAIAVLGLWLAAVADVAVAQQQAKPPAPAPAAQQPRPPGPAPAAPAAQPAAAQPAPQQPALLGRPRLREFCGADIQRFCRAVNPGQGRITRCLTRRNNQLQRSCRLYLRRPLTPVPAPNPTPPRG